MDIQILTKDLLGVSHIFRKYLMHYSKIKNVTDLKHSSFHALLILSKYSEITMQSLSNELMVSKQQLTKIIGELLTKGYVERYHDKSNLRIVYVRVTEEGLHALRKIRTASTNELSKKLELLTNDEQLKLYNAIATINEIFDKIKNMPDIKS